MGVRGAEARLRASVGKLGEGGFTTQRPEIRHLIPTAPEYPVRYCFLFRDLA